ATVGPNSFVFVRTLGRDTSQQLTTGTGWDMAPAMSPDGELIAFQRIREGARSTMVVDRQGRNPPRAIATGSMARPSWSRDGRSIWTGNNVRLERYDAASGALVETAALPAGVQALKSIELPGGALLVAMPALPGSGKAGVALLAADRTLSWLLHGDIEEVLAATSDGQRALAARVGPASTVELVELSFDGAPP